MSMDISISEQNQKRIKQIVESGRYSSADEVIGAALGLLGELDEELSQELNELRDKVQAGIEQADNGQLTPASEVFDRLLERNARRTQQL